LIGSMTVVADFLQKNKSVLLFVRIRSNFYPILIYS